MAGDPTAVIQLGAILLIATPIARVVFAVVGFALERDRFYVVVSLTVLAVLLASLIYSA
jgi:Predicted membrane protein